MKTWVCIPVSLYVIALVAPLSADCNETHEQDQKDCDVEYGQYDGGTIIHGGKCQRRCTVESESAPLDAPSQDYL